MLPWLVLVFLVASQADFRSYYATGAGVRVLIICAIVLEAGRRVVGRLGALPAEPRVLAGGRSPSPESIRPANTSLPGGPP